MRSLRAFPRSLRARLVLAAAGAILIAVGLFAGAAVVLVEHELRGTLDTSLRQRATEVAELAVSAPAVLTNPGALESPISGRQIAVEVLDSRGRLVARSETLGAHLLPEDRVVRPHSPRAVPGLRTSISTPGRSGSTRRRSRRRAVWRRAARYSSLRTAATSTKPSGTWA